MNRRRIVVPALILAVPALALLLAPESEARRDRSDYLRRQPARIGLVARQKQPRELKRWRGTVRGYPQKTGKWERPDPPARDQIISRRPKKDRDEDMPKARKGMKDQSSMMEGKGRSPGLPYDPGEVLPLDPKVTRGTLDNGLTYYVRANHKPENRAELRLVVNAGSMQEADDQKGLAHFVEHMAFNGTEHFEKQELIDFLELTGMRFGPDINAFTSFDQTVYMLQLPTDDAEIMDNGFLILRDWAGGVTFEDEEIDKERGVVLEEWRLGRGAGARMRDKQWPVIFKDSRYAERIVIGDPDILQNAPYERFRSFYEDWYRPDLMAVIAVGDFDPAEMEQRIRTTFSDLEGPENPRVRREYPVPDHDETLFAIATDPEATTASVAIYTKLDKEETRTVGDYRRDLVESLYHGMLNQRLQEILQQPDPPFRYARSGTGSFVRTKDVLFQSAGVKEGETERGLEALLTEVRRVDEHGFTQSELDRIKKNILRSYEQSYRERDKQRSGGYTWEYMSHYLDDDPSPGIEYMYPLMQEMLPTITLAEVNEAAAQWITEGNRVIAYSGPEKEGVATPTEPTLLAVFHDVRDGRVDPYVDKTKDQPLVARKPRPGEIVREKTYEEIGVTEWDLSNGVTVVLKPTDFRNDEIRLSGFSPGGHSLVPDEDHTSAIYATSLMGVSGLGEFDAVELDKALAGKVVSSWSYLSELEEGVGGRASPQDFETLMQLIYLRITAPRLDEDAVASWMVRVRENLQNRESRPETVFNDEWQRTVSQDHWRRRPSSIEKLEEIEPARALEIYRDRFSDAGDFTFLLVGNFTPEQIKPQVRTWLGGLPATGRNETWRDVGVDRPEGVTAFDVRRGMEPKSSSRVLFHGPAEWDREEAFLVNALASALQIRLREILREDMGGTYGVGVGGSIARRPDPEFTFSVGFGSAPENADGLVQAVFDEIRRAQREGFEQEVVDKIREIRLRSHEVNLKENSWWLSSLEGRYTYGEDPRKVLDYPDLVELITSDRLQETARRYLSTDQYVMGTLFPEDWEESRPMAAAAGGSAGR